MSEELLQTIPQQVGKYTYYRLGATTISQLTKAGLIPKKKYAGIASHKPDGLLFHQKQVRAVVEYKQPSLLQSEKQIQAAINQELEVARQLCKLLIVTDGSKSFWVNSQSGERVVDADGKAISEVFHPFAVKSVNEIERLVDAAQDSLSVTCSIIKPPKTIDPSPLAARLWQTIWVATGKSPVKCLYNVVELFIFKFLSDLNVLPSDSAFSGIYERSRVDAADALDFYARNTRPRIVKLFPPGADGTTIINGTIFVSETGEANLSQAILFQRSLSHLHQYGESVGTLTRVDKNFKTRLYESFLKQEVEALGQYFTPRRVVQAVIRMSGADASDFAYSGKRFCDPFCGVGGFPLELLNMNESMREAYRPNLEGEVSPGFTLNGFDKGFERDDERTIILAKANMLIYLAELVFANPGRTESFAEAFNSTFQLFKDNLGTFGHIIKDDEQKYDYVFSNPPYVTSGSSIIKEEIKKNPKTSQAYPINALGLEGISMEWIVKSLAPGGKAFVVIPDGILARVGGRKLRDFILRECFLDGLVSLPVRTFFANWERTYVLAVTKKQNNAEAQTDPVFTYIVSDIGEKLTSVRREEIEDDDLPEMVVLFRMFLGAKTESADLLQKQSPRCKVFPISRFSEGAHRVIDRWWTVEERKLLRGSGDEEIDAGALAALAGKLTSSIQEYQARLDDADSDVARWVEVELGDESLFKLSIGDRVLKDNASNDTSLVPVYSANVFKPMGYLPTSNIDKFDRPSILWGIDGNFEFSLVPANDRFRTTDHCGLLRVRVDDILPEYLMFALDQQRRQESFDRSFRASLTNMRMFRVKIPVDEDGGFDVESQTGIAEKFAIAEEKRTALASVKRDLDRKYKLYVSGVLA